MCWEPFAVVRFDLGPLVQGQTAVAKLKSAISRLLSRLLLCPPHWGVDILFLLFPPSGVRRPTWFPDILGNSSYPIFTKFGMQVYWANSLYGIAFGDDSSIAN